MKKFLATLFIAAALLTACTEKEDNGNNNNQNQEPTIVSLAGTSWIGTVTNDPEELHYGGGVLITSATYRAVFVDAENGTLSYQMTTLVDGDSYDDEDTTDITYTFDGTANGVMMVEGAAMPFRYNATDNTIVIPVDDEGGNELVVSEIVLHQETDSLIR